jgi:hypothetical protein
MNYSRRQLYALGEPLGESVTRLKPGGRVYGGGGGPAPNPDKTTQTVELPEWARPYAKDALAKGAALTDIEKNPYQQYGGERIAGFQPMQQQAFQGAANMQPSAQVGLGSGIAGMAGVGALNTNYQGGQFEGGQFDNQAAQQYMNPYTQNVVDYQKSQALRDFQIAQPMRQAQAVQQGAFGGSRSAIVDAEAQRSLNSQLQGITATGQQAAFQNAQQQFNADQARRLQAQGMGESSRQYGAGLGMQGLQTGLQAAGQLGQLGQTQYGQQMGINQLQSQYGQQQQQQAQRPLDMAYQDFQNQQNYPYKQLGFMSDMIRGLPLGQQSTSSIYEQGPSTVQTLAGLGGAAYGFGRSGMFGGSNNAAEGGLMDSYAEGGDVKTYAGDEGSVTSEDNVQGIIDDLSDQQLQQAKEAALNRQDVEQAKMIDKEMAERASIRGGLGGAFNQLPLEQQETMMAANGGIVAFAPGGTTYSKRFEKSLTDLKEMANKAPVEPTPEQRDEAISARIPILEKRYGPDITQPYLEETKAKREKLPEQMEKDQGLAIAMASLGLLARKKRPGEGKNQQLIAGLGEAGLQFAGEVGKLKKESREADDKLRQSEILLATAQQSRKEGLISKADAEETRAQDLKRDGFKTNLGVQEKIAQLESGLAGTEMQGENSLRVAGVQGENALKVANVNVAGQLAAAKLNKEAGATADRQIASLAARLKEKNPNMSAAEVNDRATRDYLNLSGRYPGESKAADARATLYDKISDNVDDRLVTDGTYRKLQKADKKTGGTTADQYREQLIAAAMDKARSDNAGAQGQPAPAAQQQQATPVKVTSQEQFAKLPSGTTFVAPDGSVRIKP